MFGYIEPDKPNLYIKDYTLYRAFYCGLCKGLGHKCGVMSRFTLNYDMTFLSALFHNIKGVDININRERCMLHWFVKRPVAKMDDLTGRLAIVNLILSYFKLKDDVLDSGKKKNTFRLFKTAYKKASSSEPEINLAIEKNYSKLVVLEENKCDSIDRVADPFGNMMAEIAEIVLEDKITPEIKDLSYLLGKWVYIIDAVDDFNKDIKNKEYNPFKYIYTDVKSKEELVVSKKDDLDFIFQSIFHELKSDLKKIAFKFNHDLTDNIILKGLPRKTEMVLSGCTKCMRNKELKIKDKGDI